jgi:carbon-monoxide dehydrogenase iron sulfur subunit
MMNKLYVNPQSCSGCKLCVMNCSFRHFNVSAPFLSNIRIMGRETHAAFVPTLCRQCDGKFCIDSCPEEALSVVEATGAIHIDHVKCILCGSCVAACPVDGIYISMNPEGEEFLMVCDLCDGDPQCVKYCRLGALKYE